MMFAIITPALITGATADRLKFAGWAVFLTVWSIVIYPQVAHWLFNPAGWLAQLGAQDWAGGIVVHACAGASALAVMAVVGRRRGWPEASDTKHSIPLVIIGFGILWFGWFGFNAGDGLQVNAVTAQALLNTHIAAAAGMLTWLFVEWRREGKPTVLGAADRGGRRPGHDHALRRLRGRRSGPVHRRLRRRGLPAGHQAEVPVQVRRRARRHRRPLPGRHPRRAAAGHLRERRGQRRRQERPAVGGGVTLLGNQVVALVVVIAFSFVVTWVIATVIQRTIGLRSDPRMKATSTRCSRGWPPTRPDPIDLDLARTVGLGDA